MAVIEAELKKHLADLQAIDQYIKGLANVSQRTEHQIVTFVETALPDLGVSRFCSIGKLSQPQLDALNGFRAAKGLDPVRRRDIGIPSKRLPHIYAARIFRDDTPWGDLEKTYRLALANTSAVSMEFRAGIGMNSLLISGIPRQNHLSQVVIDRAVGNITRSGMFELRSAYGKK